MSKSLFGFIYCSEVFNILRYSSKWIGSLKLSTPNAILSNASLLYVNAQAMHAWWNEHI